MLNFPERIVLTCFVEANRRVDILDYRNNVVIHVQCANIVHGCIKTRVQLVDTVAKYTQAERHCNLVPHRASIVARRLNAKTKANAAGRRTVEDLFVGGVEFTKYALPNVVHGLQECRVVVLISVGRRFGGPRQVSAHVV